MVKLFVIICRPQNKDSNLPTAVHFTKMKLNGQRKGIFRVGFLNKFEHKETPYEVVVLQNSKNKDRGFYNRELVKKTVKKIAETENYWVQQKTGIWGPMQKIEPIPKLRKEKIDKRERYQVVPFDEETLREYVCKCVKDKSVIGCTANLLFEHNIPLFTKDSRKEGLYHLLNQTIRIKNKFAEEILDLSQSAMNKKMIDRAHDLQDLAFQYMEIQTDVYNSPDRIKAVYRQLSQMYGYAAQ